MSWRFKATVGTGVLLVLLALQGIGSPPRVAASPKRVPVVLIHGFLPAAETWGLPPRREGLFQELVAAGYEPGRTLFWSPAPPWRDPVASVRRELIPLLERVRVRSGVDAVDLVVHGTGALDAQQLLAVIREDPSRTAAVPRVRQVVAVAPVWSGHAAAEVLRLASFRDALIGWHQRRRLPRNLDLDQSRAGTGAFEEEVAYVIRRAYDLYEPLYHRFLRESWFFGASKEALPTPTFWEWFAQRHPDWFTDWFVEDAPLAEVVGGDWGGDWPAGTDLSRAYYELVAFESARFAYRRLQPLRDVLLDGWQEDLELTGDWRQVVGRFALQRLRHVLARLGPPVLEHVRDRGWVAWFEHASGVDTLDPALRRLVRRHLEEESLPGGRFTANVWSRSIALPVGPGARPAGPRVVEILGHWTGPLAILAGGTAAEAEGEVASDWDDVLHHVTGWWGVDAHQLPGRPAVWRLVVQELRRFEEATVLGATSGSVRHRVDDRGPSYFRLQVEPGWVQELALNVESIAGAERVVAWVLDAYGRRRDVRLLEPRRGVSLVVGPGDVVGVRVAPPPSGQGQRARRQPVADVTLRVGDVRSMASEPMADSQVPAAVRASMDRRRSTVPAGPAGGVHATEPPGHPASGMGRTDPYSGEAPVIRVVLHSKRTTRQPLPESAANGLEDIARDLAARGSQPPHVELELDGPRTWVVGRPALFQVRARIDLPPEAAIVEERYDPGQRFYVIWERPGHDFEVSAILQLRVRYRFAQGEQRTIRFVYSVTRRVDVLAIGSDGGTSATWRAPDRTATMGREEARPG